MAGPGIRVKKALNPWESRLEDATDANEKDDVGSGGGIRTPGLVVNSHPLYR